MNPKMKMTTLVVLFFDSSTKGHNRYFIQQLKEARKNSNWSGTHYVDQAGLRFDGNPNSQELFSTLKLEHLTELPSLAELSSEFLLEVNF